MIASTFSSPPVLYSLFLILYFLFRPLILHFLFNILHFSFHRPYLLQVTFLLLYLSFLPAQSPNVGHFPAETSISAIPDADPTDGIVLIAPPTANSTGAATTSFPIKLPGGRLGMSPDISINYHHEHNHGWLGKGWDLSLPAVTVETRWGVPRFDPINESETYLLNGEQLAPVAHRGPIRSRSADLRFYQRIEVDFARITRHGNAPNNYWWEINYTDGSTSFYGGLPNQELIPSSTLQDNNGNLVHWAITATVDPNGNRIDYHYQRQNDPGRPGTEQGVELYPDYIRFTGFGEEEGPYQVRFIRDRQLGEGRRADVRIDANLGFKRVTADLLRRVEITYNNQPIRSYELTYSAGAMGKTLLTSLAEIDAVGEEFYRHEFNYYDEVSQNNGSLNLFGSAEQWSPGDDNVRAFLPIQDLPLGFTNRISSLGGATSTNTQFGMAVTFGPAGSPATKDFTVGGSVGGGGSESKGVLALVDINGDNLPDKIIRREDALVYRANLGNGDFSEIRPVNGIREFNITKSSEFNFGFEANIPPIFAGYEDTDERTETNTYFNDFNGDDLVDINLRGTIYFNHLDANGNPTFTTNSADTESPIISGAAPDPDLVTVDPQEQENLIDQTPLHDVVRVWEAPWNGNITIHGPVQLVEFTDPAAQAYTRNDGVKISIQHGPNVRFATTINPDDFTPRIPDNVNNFAVNAGDRIYFRVQSIFDGAYDRVQWDPFIVYEGVDTTLIDANRLPIHTFRASEDFFLASNQTLNLPFDGTVTIAGNFTKPPATDTVKLAAFKLSDELLEPIEIIGNYSFSTDSAVENLPLSLENVTVDSGDIIYLRMWSDTRVDWSAISWGPQLTYTALADGTSANGADGNPRYVFCPSVDAGIYAKSIRKPQLWVSPDSATYQLNLNAPPGTGAPEQTGSLFISVKSFDSLYQSIQTPTLTVEDELQTSLTFQARAGDSLFFDVHTNNQTIANWLDQELSVSVVNTSVGGLEDFTGAGLYRNSTADEEIFGNGHRGWGQFVYNGNRGRADIPIQEALLFIPEVTVDEEDLEDIEIDTANLDDPGAFDDIENLGGDPTMEIFIPMIADAKVGHYRAYDDLTLLGPGFISSSRFGVDDILLTPSFGGGGTAPSIISESSIHAVAGGVSAGPGSLGVSHAWNDTKNVLDVMDMNGDKYPDLVSETRIQYTGVYGGLTEQSLSHSFGSHAVHSEATGVTAGGKFVDSGPSNSAQSSGKGSRKKFRKAKAKTKNSGAKAQSANESAENSGSLGGSLTFDEDWAENSWFDVNGDGLTDKVFRGGDVALNYGYRFGPRENWGFPEIRRGVSQDFGVNAGINISNNSIAGGFGFTRTDNHTRRSLQDINNDGLADFLIFNDDNNQLSVRLNNGTGFTDPILVATLEKNLDSGDGTAQAANAAVTVCINIFFVRICFNPSGSTGWGASRVLSQFDDLDGDGFLDEVYGSTDSELFVRRSKIGKTNLLRSISGPLGGTIVVDYTPAEKGYQLPFSKWVLSEVAVADGVAGDGPDWRRTRMRYQNPRYDRHEREFYGFGKVYEDQLDTENNDALFRSYVSEYANNNFYEKGLLTKSYILDNQGRRFREQEDVYEFRNILTNQELPPNLITSDQGMAFPALIERTDRYFEGDSLARLTERFTYIYDTVGNVLVTTRTGNGQTEDFERTVYTYHNVPGLYLKSVVASTRTSGDGEWLRYSETEIDEKGRVVQVREFLDEETFAPVDMAYDEYGNLLSLTRPPNANGERNTYNYTYDSILHTFKESTTDHFGFQSKRSYEPLFEQAVTNQDIYGGVTEYLIDDCGRVNQIKYPRDSVYSFRFTYFTGAEIPYAQTERYDPHHDQGILGYTFADGLGRIIQEKHSAIVEGEGENIRLIVSGTTVFDAFDREAENYYPITEPLGNGPTFNPAVSNITPALTSFDVLDRELSYTSPSGNMATRNYDIAVDNNGLPAFRNLLTDPLGNQTATYTDVRGRQQAHQTISIDGDIWFNTTYNIVGEVLLQTSAAGTCEVSKTYDHLGRMLAETPCNAGKTTYEYDLAGNLLREITPNLRAINEEAPLAIHYTYEFDRLRQIDYPKNYQNRVELFYGEPDAPHFRAGRMWLRLDASGGEEFFFDIDGNVTKSIRTLLINEASVRTYVSEATFDSWGRLTHLDYPDGEHVDYSYRIDGKLAGMSGARDDRTYAYVNSSHYDHFDNLVRRELGNGNEQIYTYNPQNRRLDRLQIAGSNGPVHDLNYTYDPLGNPLEIRQSTGPNANNIGASSLHTFDYDDLYQLTEAVGSWNRAEGEESYSYFAQFDDAYNLTSREISRALNGEPLSQDSEIAIFEYADDFPHRVVELSGRTFDYDANGNQLGYQGERGSYRFQNYRWDEENRLTGISQNGRISQFTYAADGQRAIRSQGKSLGVFTDGAPSGSINHGSDYVAYISPFFEARKDGFTKHYFVGDDRIASKTGTGEFNNYYWFGRGLTAGDQNFTARLQDLENTVWNYYGELGVPPGPPTLPGYYAQPEQTGEALPTPTATSFTSNPPPGWPGPLGPPALDGPPGPPTWFPPETPRDSIRAGYGFESFAVFPEVDQYFYHQDLLGNTHCVTDVNGDLRQFNAYLPTGEIAFHQSRENGTTPYTFNGMETDPTGGFYYFGSRYYDAETGIWLSIDPLADDYPGHNPYAFTLNNSMRFSDLDGREAFDPFPTEFQAAADFARIYNKKSIARNWEYGTNIYRRTINGQDVYYYDNPATDRQSSAVTPPARNSLLGEMVADIHTHSRMSHAPGAEGFNDFSQADIDDNNRQGIPGYIANPRGELKRYDPGTGKTELVATGLPYDKRYYRNGDPNRKQRRQRRGMNMEKLTGLGQPNANRREARLDGNIDPLPLAALTGFGVDAPAPPAPATRPTRKRPVRRGPGRRNRRR